MIPYQQMKTMADQKMANYREQAEDYRMAQRKSSLGEFLKNIGRQGLSRSGASRVGNVLFGRHNGPVQPAI